MNDNEIRAARALLGVLSDIEATAGQMPITQVRVLLQVYLDVQSNGTTTATELCRELRVIKSSMNRLVTNLSDLSWTKKQGIGLIEYVPDPADTRVKPFRLSPKGSANMSKWMKGFLRGITKIDVPKN